MSGVALARAAEALAGCRFRLHGRDPATGLDCIGVLHAALLAIGRPVPLPTGYALRTRDISRWLPEPASCGFVPANGSPRAGDVLLARPHAVQAHLLIALRADCFVHAHAGLGRVVIGRLSDAWPIAGHWRLAEI